MIGQVDLYFRGLKKHLPAHLNNFLVEVELAKEFHWTPNQIKDIDYKWLQMYFAIENQRNVSAEMKRKTKEALDKFQSKSKRR